MNNSREVALEILNGVIYKKSYSNIILGVNIEKSDLNRKDRALVTEIVYGTIKYKYTIDVIIKYFVKRDINSLDRAILNILREAIYQIRYLTRVPDFAVVNEAVNLAKKKNSIGASKFVNGVLRNFLRNKDKDFIKFKNETEKLSFTYSFKPWMVNLFINQYGKNRTLEIMKGLNEVPGVCVRVNSLKVDYDDALKALTERKFQVTEGSVCPEAITITKGESIEHNELFNNGLITVQDESAMLVAPLMQLLENDIVMDMCSAPGTKATHIAEILNNTGKVMSFDVHKNKLNLIEQNAKRLGITNIECREMDSSIYDEKYVECADKILIDVPCSGLGIIRKKPEIKWNKTKKDLTNITDVQRNIMENAAKYLKVGGYLMYSTCTLNTEENSGNIMWFIKKHPEFKIDPVYFGKADNILYNNMGWATIIPNKYMDGFFICRLKKFGRC